MARIISASNQGLAISRVVADLRRGRQVALPTETVYGLAADATSGEAVAGIFRMKGRPSFNPLICHVDGLLMAEEIGQMTPVAKRLADAFWPGPLTMVVEKLPGSSIHDLVSANLGTVGIRCPKGITRSVISAFGKPLAAPSANRSGRISPTSAAHVAEEFAEEDLLVIDEGRSPVGLESTIVKVLDDQLVVLREGAVSREALSRDTGLPVTSSDASNKVEAPGMMQSHYAPDASVQLNCNSAPSGSAWLGFGNRPVPPGVAASRNLSPDSNLTEAAANLYACLKELDGLGAPLICIAPIPEEGLGIAINDRLRRAAAPRQVVEKSVNQSQGISR